MRSSIYAALVILAIMCSACSDSSTPVLPSPTTDLTIGFGGLAGLPCSGPPQTPANASCGVNSYTESGVTVSAASAEWSARTDYGRPAPFIEFYLPCIGIPCAAPANPAIGSVQITAGGARFSFKSVDLYASLVPVPYTITGLRNSNPLFTITNTWPNPFGDFATVVNQQASALIDTLIITLTNGGGAMGLDNIVVVISN